METIRLNVSGSLFEIEKDTLMKSDYFSNMFSGNWATVIQPVFVPCGIEAFDQMIRFLRFEQKFDMVYIPEFDYFGVRYTDEDLKTPSSPDGDEIIKDRNLDIYFKKLFITEKIYKLRSLTTRGREDNIYAEQVDKMSRIYEQAQKEMKTLKRSLGVYHDNFRK